jgi:CxxC motif-containing protein (DUF1111 family)
MRALLLLPALLLPAIVFAADDLDRALGKALFERIWVPAPASTDAANGLGPLFSERSCVSCHGGPGGGASIAFTDSGVVARGLSIRFADAEGSPDPNYGTGFQARAVPGLGSEGTVTVRGAGSDAPLAITLGPSRGALAPQTRMSLRLAPPLVARGRLDAIDPAAILARADPDDVNGDGISGRPNRIDTPNGPIIGRYGWKAEQPNLARQVAHAFAFDLGLSSPIFPLPYGDCTRAETDCLGAPNGQSARFDDQEISTQIIDLIAGYVYGLEPEAGEPDKVGGMIFSDLGCIACHMPSLPAKDGTQVIVYSDILLHDMGPELDDGVGAPGVRSSEWRTAPLAGLAWSRGTTRRYLHDGRAPTLDAAIRAHGGEAAGARSGYLSLRPEDRAKLIAFLETL